MVKIYCPACYPKKVRSHWDSYLPELLDIFWGDLFFSRKPEAQLPRFPFWFSFTHLWYVFLSFVGLVRFSADFEKKDHYPRSWVVIQEAKRRGIHVESISILGRVTSYYRVRFGTRYYYYDALPSRFLNFCVDDKYYVKQKLISQGYPAPAGKRFWRAGSAIRYGLSLGFPLVVKPARGTHAYHVTAPVNNREELKRAVALAQQYQPRFIVEKFLPQRLYRVTVINFFHVFVARREPPNVTGDGVHMVRELIEIKNSDPVRGETGQKQSTLHKIAFNENTAAALTRLGYTLDSVPPSGEKVILHNKISIGSGGDVMEETPLLHSENKEMFRRAARLFGADLVGFDFVAEDLAKPYSGQECGIIEANSIPMIDFHHNPSSGAEQNVAGFLWDNILADKRVKYLFPVKISHRSVLARLFWHFLDVFLPSLRDTLTGLHIVRILQSRQPHRVGWLKSEVAPETAIAHLKLHGFEVVRPGWIDRGEIIGLRQLVEDGRRQCHVRFFDDGEVRAHLEYAPEYRPLAHLLGQGLGAAQDIVDHFLGHLLVKQKQ